MRAMILAAGRGERMRPLTDHTPKPLLEAGGKPLIAWHIERLVAAGMRDIVINCAWLGERLRAALGGGERFGARLQWSPEHSALETAGGIARALPRLGPDPFLVVNGDIWCDWDFRQAAGRAAALTATKARAWLLLVDNPPHHPLGDFRLDANGRVLTEEASAGTGEHESGRLTFSGIGVYSPELFAALSADRPAPLAPVLRAAMADGTVIGDRHAGTWMDIGTPERLQQLDTYLKA